MNIEKIMIFSAELAILLIFSYGPRSCVARRKNPPSCGIWSDSKKRETRPEWNSGIPSFLSSLTATETSVSPMFENPSIRKRGIAVHQILHRAALDFAPLAAARTGRAGRGPRIPPRRTYNPPRADATKLRLRHGRGAQPSLSA